MTRQKNQLVGTLCILAKKSFELEEKLKHASILSDNLAALEVEQQVKGGGPSPLYNIGNDTSGVMC